MSSILGVWPTESGLVFQVAAGSTSPIDVDLDGRRVWSFQAVDRPVPEEQVPAGVAPETLRFEPWPPLLRSRLRGRFSVRLRSGGSEDGPEVSVVLGGVDRPLDLTDVHDRPLVVNKWGRLGHALADADPGMVDRMLDHATAIRELLEQHLGHTVFVTGGTLLGPVREGRLLPHDDDADLAYLSRFSHPADVTLEGFEIGRLLAGAGYEVVRLSVAHLQIHFWHEGKPDHYVDVFTGFLLDGFWYQHFAIRTKAGREALLPTRPVVVGGREEPGPRDAEFMLSTIYGEGWRVPDPSFTFEIPSATARRFYGWFADYNVEREPWEDVIVLGATDGSSSAPSPLSAFARWVHDQAPADSGLLDLGCGLGADACALAGMGRTVRAVDFSRYAIRSARSRAQREGADVTFEVLNLLDTRAVIRLGAALASAAQRWTIMGKFLLNALEDRGRHNVFRVCDMLLRRGTLAHFDYVTDHEYSAIAPYRHLALEQLVAEADEHGLALVEAAPRIEPITWFDAPEAQLVGTSRITFRRRTR